MDTTLEQPTIETTEIAVAEAPKETPAEFSRGQIGKTKRAFAKAGRADASEEVRKKWLTEMSEANVVVHDIEPSISIPARLDHSTDFVVASHVGADCFGRAVFLADDFDGLVRCVLVDIGTKHLRAFAGE